MDPIVQSSPFTAGAYMDDPPIRPLSLPDDDTIATVLAEGVALARHLLKRLYLDPEDVVIEQFRRVVRGERRSGSTFKEKVLRAVRSECSHIREREARKRGLEDPAQLIDPIDEVRQARLRALFDKIRERMSADIESVQCLDSMERLAYQGVSPTPKGVAKELGREVEDVRRCFRRIRYRAQGLLGFFDEI